jgi:hypothetical protein
VFGLGLKLDDVTVVALDLALPLATTVAAVAHVGVGVGVGVNVAVAVAVAVAVGVGVNVAVAVAVVAAVAVAVAVGVGVGVVAGRSASKIAAQRLFEEIVADPGPVLPIVDFIAHAAPIVPLPVGNGALLPYNWVRAPGSVVE